MPEDLHVQRAKAQPTLPCFVASTHILRNPGLDQLLHEGSRHGLVGLETDRALADVVILEFVLVVAQHVCSIQSGSGPTTEAEAKSPFSGCEHSMQCRPP
jgi:hypothetical protein